MVILQNTLHSILQSDETSILNNIDRKIINLIKDYNISEWTIPAFINGDVLNKCGYFSTIPNNLTKVGTIKREHLDKIAKDNTNISCDSFDNNNDIYLTPAACLGIYPELSKLEIENEIITIKGNVFRYEFNSFVHRERQWNFIVREFIAIGTEEYVKKFLDEMKELALELACNISPNCFIKDASDNFYPTRVNKMRNRIQLQNDVKQELIATIDNKEVALSSFNYHSNHFSKSFNFDKGGKIVSGCVGFGLERWLKFVEVSNDISE